MTDSDLIKLILLNRTESEFKAIPVHTGIPLPQGWFQNDDMLSVQTDDDLEKIVQHQMLAQWPDGSVKWLLADLISSCGPLKQKSLYLEKNKTDSNSTDPSFGIQINSEQDRLIRVDTGKCIFTLGCNESRVFRSIKIGEKDVLDHHSSQIFFYDDRGKKRKIRISPFVLKNQGPLTCTFQSDGSILNRFNRCHLNLKISLKFFWNHAAVKMDISIHNPRAARHPGGIWDLGDSGSVFFKGFGVDFKCAMPVEKIAYRTQPCGAESILDAKRLVIHQNSSGGENWNSFNHVDCKGNLSVDFKGYYITAGEEGSRQVIAHGERSTPIVQLIGENTWFAIGVDNFWQNFPKKIQSDENTLQVGLFPDQENHLFELQGGEKKRHTVYFEAGDMENAATIIQDLLSTVKVTIEPEWVEHTGCIPGFVVQIADSNADYLNYIKNVVEGSNSFFAKKEIIDEFGWRNFGDVYADHEAAFDKSNNPLISHYNNQYDFIYGAIVHFLRSGDLRWWQLASDYARHVIDIDIYHTDKDKAGYNHGLFWHTDHYRDAGTCTHRSFTGLHLDPKKRKNYGGGPSNENNYTTGLMHYFFLTGDREAYEAVLELAGWVVDMDDGRKTVFNFIDEGPTGLASQTVFTDFHKPGRGPGNSINALMDAYQLTGSRHFFFKAEELIARCIHPFDDIAALKLGEPEFRWSYLVFLQALAKYLDRKLELDEIDYHFFYARDSLLHYADWMVANEVPYNDVLDKVEIPTETWPAQDIRKCCVLHYASKYAEPEKREVYAKKATFFFNRCLKDLGSHGTAFFTRPMVLLTTYGFYNAFFQTKGPYVIFQNHFHDFGNPIRFMPQRDRIKESSATKASVIAGFVFRGILATIDRIMRRYRNR